MNRVKEFRVKLNMSQLQLSREIDVSRQAINCKSVTYRFKFVILEYYNRRTRMKKNLQIEFIKYFYGITTELDEYVKQELSNFGNNMYMLFSFGMIGGWILSICFNQDCLTPILLISFIYSQIKQEALITKLGLNKIEVTSNEVDSAKKRLLRRIFLHVFISGIIAAMVFHGLIRGGYIIFKGFDPSSSFMVPGIIAAFIAIVLTAFIIYYSNLKNIIVVEE